AADVAERAIALAESATRQPDLAEHRGQRHREPRRLLAVLDALKRVVHVDQRALRCHAPGERAEARRWNLRQAGRPLPRLPTTLGLAAQIALEAVESARIAR